MIELVFNAGAKKVVVMDNTCHKAEDCYQRSGIEAMAKKVGAEVRYCDDNRLVVHDFKGEYLSANGRFSGTSWKSTSSSTCRSSSITAAPA